MNCYHGQNQRVKGLNLPSCHQPGLVFKKGTGKGFLSKLWFSKLCRPRSAFNLHSCTEDVISTGGETFARQDQRSEPHGNQ